MHTLQMSSHGRKRRVGHIQTAFGRRQRTIKRGAGGDLLSLVFSVGDKAVKNRELCTEWPLFGPRPFRHTIKRIMSQTGLILREFKRGNALREFVVCRERGQGEIQKGAEGEKSERKARPASFQEFLASSVVRRWPIDRRP